MRALLDASSFYVISFVLACASLAIWIGCETCSSQTESFAHADPHIKAKRRTLANLQKLCKHEFEAFVASWAVPVLKCIRNVQHTGAY
jgi:hypothetical protein